jgi:hypothetical protein
VHKALTEFKAYKVFKESKDLQVQILLLQDHKVLLERKVFKAYQDRQGMSVLQVQQGALACKALKATRET